ncbi:multicopper oxidase domain-containing protein [Streptomyces sp. NPDC001340]
MSNVVHPDGFHAESYTTLDPSRVKPNEAIYGYTNHDRSCMLWYHDHGMGMTSLNVYAGLAGLWLVRDPAVEPRRCRLRISQRVERAFLEPEVRRSQGPLQMLDFLQFWVTKPLSGGGDRATPPRELKLPAVVRIMPNPHIRRREWVVYQHKLFRTMTFNALPFMEPSQNFIKEGSSEIWEYINPNHDAHPMHVHLVNFQVLNRQPIDAAAYQADCDKWICSGRKPKDRPVLANYFTGPSSGPTTEDLVSRAWSFTG